MPLFRAKRPLSRSITFWIADPDLVSTAIRLADGFALRFPRTPIVFFTSSKFVETACYTRWMMPQRPSAIGRALKRARTHTLVHVGSPGRREFNPIAAAYARGASLLLIESTSPDAGEPASSRGRTSFDLVFDKDAASNGDQAPQREAIDALIARSRRETMMARGYTPARIRVLRFLRRYARPLFDAKFREYHSISALRRQLQDPETILCLGNGPSSEDPEVAKTAYDCLFRVNIGWQQRDRFPVPDLIFTGLAEAVSKAKPRAGFMFGKIQSEEAILARHLTSRHFFRYASCERLELVDAKTASASAPTNGALMVATAVALNPRRLVISGIDLYRHPAGAYPDDNHTPNTYAVGHDPHTEIEYLTQALRAYRGELIVLSLALRESLRNRDIFASAHVSDLRRRLR